MFPQGHSSVLLLTKRVLGPPVGQSFSQTHLVTLITPLKEGIVSAYRVLGREI
jgi:hypothetical protein